MRLATFPATAELIGSDVSVLRSCPPYWRDCRRELVVGRKLLDLKLWRHGYVMSEVTAEADPKDSDELHQLLLEAVERDGRDETQLGDYQLEVHDHHNHDHLMNFVARNR